MDCFIQISVVLCPSSNSFIIKGTRCEKPAADKSSNFNCCLDLKIATCPLALRMTCDFQEILTYPTNQLSSHMTVHVYVLAMNDKKISLSILEQIPKFILWFMPILQ